MYFNCESCAGEGRLEGWFVGKRTATYKSRPCKACHGTGKVSSRTRERERAAFDRWAAERAESAW